MWRTNKQQTVWFPIGRFPSSSASCVSLFVVCSSVRLQFYMMMGTLLLQPEIAKAAAQYRINTLPAAQNLSGLFGCVCVICVCV